MDKQHASAKVGFVSLGCPKALVDSERMLTQLKLDGYEIVPNYGEADVVVVNTCGFIDSAKAESLETIGEALNENGRVIVTGCLGAQESAIRDIHPSVLSVSGPQQYESVLDAVHQHVPIEREHDHDPYVDLVPPQGIKLTPRHYAYLKISEGCNHSCSFCIIPSMRGRLVSRPVADVVEEAERLVANGVRELLIISQDTSAYGSDIKYRTGFSNGRPIKADMYGLCEALGDLGVWVRLHYVYPYPHVDKVIPLMAADKLLPYLDIPFQHGSPRVLKAMRRPAHAENTLERIEKWRLGCPDIAIRSTFIVGFPGETEDDFATLLDFIEAAELDRVGCFQYSPVDGAAANALPNAISEAEKQARWDTFMQTQQAVSHARLTRKIGRTLEVLVDEVSEQGIIARSFADAPEIDGVVHIRDEQHLDVNPGEFYQVKIEQADDYDLFGTIVD